MILNSDAIAATLQAAIDERDALKDENERLRSALEGKVWEPTLEAALLDLGDCLARGDGLRDDEVYKRWRPLIDSLRLDRLSPQEPTTGGQSRTD